MYEALWGLREPESRRARQDRAEGALGPGAGSVFLPLSAPVQAAPESIAPSLKQAQGFQQGRCPLGISLLALIRLLGPCVSSLRAVWWVLGEVGAAA